MSNVWVDGWTQWGIEIIARVPKPEAARSTSQNNAHCERASYPGMIQLSRSSNGKHIAFLFPKGDAIFLFVAHSHTM